MNISPTVGTKQFRGWRHPVDHRWRLIAWDGDANTFLDGVGAPAILETADKLHPPVSREEYEALKVEGWTSTPKQDCDFVATWSPNRRKTAMEYGEGFIGGEDQGPADRAADRAQRFGDYREKRMGEALNHADHYNDGPMAHGFQNKARAVRAADRHDRIAGRAVDAWSKTEYWQSRTAGVISHALYVSTPAVRMGRIKVLESEQRKHLATLETYKTLYHKWALVAVLTSKDDLPKGYLPVTPEVQTALATRLAGDTPGGYDYPHPVTGTKKLTMVPPHG